MAYDHGMITADLLIELISMIFHLTRNPDPGSRFDRIPKDTFRWN